MAGREKDLEFMCEMVRHGMLDPAMVRDGIALLPEGAGEGADLEMRWTRVEGSWRIGAD